MSYTSTPIFYKKPIPGVDMYRPTGPVDCRVVRAALFGSHEAGDLGVYHAGMLFQADDREWAIELVLTDFGNLVPTIVNGAVVLDNWMTLGYYPPLDAHMWRSYWTLTSDLVCTLRPAQYEQLVQWLLGVFGPTFPRYVPFGITGKPTAMIGAESERQSDAVYAVDNTCDKLGMRSFEWLATSLGVRVEPFPITRLALQATAPPIRVAPNDPGLLTHAREMIALKAGFSALHNKDYAGLLKLLAQAAAIRPGAFRYALSLDPVGFHQSYYAMPAGDITVSISDVFVRIDPRAQPPERLVVPLPLDPVSWGAQSSAMWSPNDPIPATSVPCAQLMAVGSAWDMNTAYDDRRHAEQIQDINDSCVYGRRPPRLPTWPPATLDNYPKSGRMQGDEVGEVANTASIVTAQRDLQAVGQTQPAELSFGRSATGALVIQSNPLPQHGTAPAVANASLVYNQHWRLPVETPEPAQRARLVPSAVGAATRPPHTSAVRSYEPAYEPPYAQAGHPSAFHGIDAFGAAAVAVPAVPKKKTSRALRSAQTHAGNLANAIPGLIYDMAHADDIRSAAGSRYSAPEYVFGRGSRGLYISIIFATAAVIAGAVRCIDH